MKYAKIFLAFALVLACKNETPMEPPPNGSMLEPQWAMYGGNVRHTGNVNTPAYDGIIGPTDSNTVAVKWAVNLNELIGFGNVQSQPVSDKDGNVYLTTIGGLVALDLNGGLKWHFDELGRAPAAIGDDGTVYYHGNSGNLYALNGGGSVKWKALTFKARNPNSSFKTTWMNLVFLDHNVVAIAGRDSLKPTVVALNGSDGSIIWKQKFEENSPLMSIMAVDDDGTLYVYQGTPNARVFAISSEGSIKWSLDKPAGGGAANFHVLIDAGQKVYEFGYVLSTTGQILEPNTMPGLGAMWFDKYYTLGLKDTLVCYSVSDQRILWRTRPQGVRSLSFPTVDAAGHVYLLGGGQPSPRIIPGYFVAYDKDGRLLIRKEIHASEIENFTFRARYEPVLISDGSVVVVGDETCPIVVAIH